MPEDGFGRDINYLRLSLIDNCNLRCVYCMPMEGLTFAPAPELLTPEEFATVARAAATVGFHKIRLTGGEPLLRADLVEIVEKISRIDGITDLSMTTNGVRLPQLAHRLKAAGLHRVNIHLDTLDRDHLKRVMRLGSFDAIWSGIEAAQAAGLHPIKINVVVVRDYNEDDVVDMARLTMDRDWHVRFIELMPLGGGECARLSLRQYVSNTQTRERIEEVLGPLTPILSHDPSDEARNYRLEDAPGVVGFISPVSEPYCGTCNRMRLTADGQFHLCLLNDDELDVKRALRNGGGEEAVARILLKAIAFKPTGHRLSQGHAPQQRSMYQIGG
ncbi:MAG: GTP 3',8-cyclase MoaA [Planctomycetes bacterium]|nr:GTP 3',8-cyclase MoaA [Planctomycetota bacterium]